MGNDDTPALAGEAFLSKWDGRTAGDLFDRIRSSMPDDNPGQLSNQQYADVLAHILSENEFPAGQKELDKDAAPLKEIRIEEKK